MTVPDKLHQTRAYPLGIAAPPAVVIAASQAATPVSELPVSRDQDRVAAALEFRHRNVTVTEEVYRARACPRGVVAPPAVAVVAGEVPTRGRELATRRDQDRIAVGFRCRRAL